MKSIELSDKTIFDKYFQEYPPEISEYTFTNLFMWRDFYKFQWIEIENSILLVSYRDPLKLIVFPPIGINLNPMFKYIRQMAKDQNKSIQFERIPSSMISIFKETFSNCEVREDRENWDYIYASENLRDLSGKELANERKKLNKFKNNNRWEYVDLTEKEIPECIKLQASWCGVRACDDNPVLHTEDLAIQEIFKEWKTLRFIGGLIRIDGIIQAYTVGEPLNLSTLVIHVEKANSEITGLYQTINQQFAERNANQFQFINREQDLGIPNLRYAKENYHPIKMGKKYCIIIS